MPSARPYCFVLVIEWVIVFTTTNVLLPEWVVKQCYGVIIPCMIGFNPKHALELLLDLKGLCFSMVEA